MEYTTYARLMPYRTLVGVLIWCKLITLFFDKTDTGLKAVVQYIRCHFRRSSELNMTRAGCSSTVDGYAAVLLLPFYTASLNFPCPVCYSYSESMPVTTVEPLLWCVVVVLFNEEIWYEPEALQTYWPGGENYDLLHDGSRLLLNSIYWTHTVLQGPLLHSLLLAWRILFFLR